jgi:hypothetical protein
MIGFLCRAASLKEGQFIPTFPENNHRRPETIRADRFKNSPTPAEHKDLRAANTLQDDCSLLPGETISRLLNAISIDVDIHDQALSLNIDTLIAAIKVLQQESQRACSTVDKGLLAIGDRLFCLAAEGRFAGATHFTITPVFKKDHHDA